MNQTKNCKNCGNLFTRNKRYSQKQWQKARFCGPICRVLSSIDSKKRKTFVCLECAEEWSDYKSNDNNKQFCSVACKSSFSRIDRKCKQCKEIFSICKSTLKTNASGNFCSRSCYEKWMCKTDMITGRGSQWKKIRAKVLEKTPYCSFCCQKEKLHVHHIIPYRLTRDNGLDNLMSLCPRHHKIAETITHGIENIETDLERMKILLKNIFSERIMIVHP